MQKGLHLVPLIDKKQVFANQLADYKHYSLTLLSAKLQL
jgi:hypothetical protein